MKRIRNVLALLLCFALCMCLSPMVGADNYADESITAKLESVLAEYPNGSTWTGSFDGGSQCYGFAKLVVYRLFGKYSDSKYRSWLYNGNSSSGMLKIDAVENCTSTNVQSLLQKALPGDVLQFDTGNTSGHQHSMIVYSVTGNGAEIYECNWTKNTVTKTSLTSIQIANRQTRSDGTKRGTLSLLRSDNYPTVDSSVQAYLNQCTSWSCNVILTVTTAGNMKNMPCSVSTNAQSQTVETLTTGDKYSSTRRWTNTGGSYWYEVVSKSGQRGFIYAGDVSIVNTPSTLHIDGNESGTPSGKLTKGANFGLRGIITSNYPIALVEAHIYDSNGHDAIPAYRATGLNVTSYNIKDDGINNHFSFALLPEGEYHYMVFARDTSMAVERALIDSRFTIGTVTYTVSYNANGGTGAPSSQTKTYGTNLTLSSTKPTRANSSAGSYTVTLDANGGSVNTTSLSAARTTNYTFKNWNTAANGSGTNYNAGASYIANASATLYAQWNSSTTTSAITLPTPTRTGYIFKGWNTSSTATSGVTGSYTPIENVTLYATWEAIAYRIIYNVNGGTGEPSQQIKYHDVGIVLSSIVPTRPGYTFSGWAESADATTATYLPGGDFAKNADTTLYAVWQKKAPDFILPAALTEIGEEAFADCAFGYVHIPDGVTRIAYSRFPRPAGP